jgi:hypothetical protein
LDAVRDLDVLSEKLAGGKFDQNQIVQLFTALTKAGPASLSDPQTTRQIIAALRICYQELDDKPSGDKTILETLDEMERLIGLQPYCTPNDRSLITRKAIDAALNTRGKSDTEFAVQVMVAHTSRQFVSNLLQPGTIVEWQTQVDRARTAAYRCLSISSHDRLALEKLFSKLQQFTN